MGEKRWTTWEFQQGNSWVERFAPPFLAIEQDTHSWRELKEKEVIDLTGWVLPGHGDTLEHHAGGNAFKNGHLARLGQVQT